MICGRTCCTVDGCFFVLVGLWWVRRGVWACKEQCAGRTHVPWHSFVRLLTQAPTLLLAGCVWGKARPQQVSTGCTHHPLLYYYVLILLTCTSTTQLHYEEGFILPV